MQIYYTSVENRNYASSVLFIWVKTTGWSAKSKESQSCFPRPYMSFDLIHKSFQPWYFSTHLCIYYIDAMSLEEKGGDSQIRKSSKMTHWQDGDQSPDKGRAAHRPLIRKDPDAGKDWGQEEKGTTEDDGSIMSPTQWTWVWVNSRSWWWTGRPGMLQFMG